MKKFNMRKGRQGQQYCTVRESTAKGREGPDRDHWYVGTPDALVSKLERAAHLEQVVPELEARVAKAEALAAKEKERAAGLLDATRIVAEAMIKLSVDEPTRLDPEVVRMAERLLVAPAAAPAREDETAAREVPPAVPDGDDNMGTVESSGTVLAAMTQDSPSGNSQVEAPVVRDATIDGQVGDAATEAPWRDSPAAEAIMRETSGNGQRIMISLPRGYHDWAGIGAILDGGEVGAGHLPSEVIVLPHTSDDRCEEIVRLAVENFHQSKTIASLEEELVRQVEAARITAEDTAARENEIGQYRALIADIRSRPFGNVGHVLTTKSFGGVWLADLLLREAGIETIVNNAVTSNMTSFSVGLGVYLLVMNHLCGIGASTNRLIEKFSTTAIDVIKPNCLKKADPVHFGRIMDLFTADFADCVGNFCREKIRQITLGENNTFHYDQSNQHCHHDTGVLKGTLLRFGHSKSNNNDDVQYGVAVLVNNGTRIPILYFTYPGHWHDSKQFSDKIYVVIDAIKNSPVEGKKYLSHDKGNYCQAVRDAFANEADIFFLTTYSINNAKDLIAIPDGDLRILNIAKNAKLKSEGKEDKAIRCYELPLDCYGDKYKWVLISNPRTAERRTHTLERHLTKQHDFLHESVVKFNSSPRKSDDVKSVIKGYTDFCNKHKYKSDHYSIMPDREANGTYKITYKKNYPIIDTYKLSFGKFIIITDDTELTAEEMYTKTNGNWCAESCFKSVKDRRSIASQPCYVKLDNHIAVHSNACFIAEALEKHLEQKLRENGLKITGKRAIELMNRLSCQVISFENGVKPIISVNEPTEEVAEVLAALGYYWAKGTLLKCGTPPPMVWGWTRGRGRPPGSRNKPKVAPPNAQV